MAQSVSAVCPTCSVRLDTLLYRVVPILPVPHQSDKSIGVAQVLLICCPNCGVVLGTPPLPEAPPSGAPRPSSQGPVDPTGVEIIAE